METEPQRLGDILASRPQRPAARKSALRNGLRTLPPEFIVAIGKRRGMGQRHIDAWMNEKAEQVECKPWKEVEALVQTWLGTGAVLILSGPRGSGKTQLAVNAACDTMDHGHCPDEETEWPLVRDAIAIFEDVRASFRDDSSDSEKRIISRYLVPILLVIDEAQERGHTEFEDRTLVRIVNERYCQMLDTLIITNLQRDAITKSLGTSIVSRLHECGEVIECNWPSFRERR